MNLKNFHKVVENTPQEIKDYVSRQMDQWDARQRLFNAVCYIMIFALVCICFGLLSSCTTERKVLKYLDTHQELLAKECAEAYPVKESDSTTTTTFDSSEYIRSIADLKEWIGHLNNINDSLLYDIIHKDTTCAKYAPIIRYLRAQNAKLEGRLANIKPVVLKEYTEKKVIDSAAMAVKNNQIKALQAQLQAKDKSIAVLQDNVKEAKEGRNWWRTAALLTWCVIALFVAYKVFTPKIPFIK